MRSLAGSLADDVLADALFKSSPPTNKRTVKGPQKSTVTSKTEKKITSK